MSESLRRRGALVPGTEVWTADEDELVKSLPVEEVVKRRRRTLKSVYAWRRRLGRPDARRRD
jgi:hypothetical protein